MITTSARRRSLGALTLLAVALGGSSVAAAARPISSTLQRTCEVTGGEYVGAGSAYPTCVDVRTSARALERAERECHTFRGAFQIVADDGERATWTCDFSAL